MIAIYPGRARARLLAACFASSCLFADVVWAQDPVPVAAPSEIQPAGTVNESLPLTVFGWGSAEPAAVADQPATSATTMTQESAAEPGRLAPQDTLEASATNQSADSSVLPATMAPDSAVGAVVAPNAGESTSNAAAEPAAAAGPVTVESTSPVPAAETQASVSTAAEHLPDTLGGESSPSASSVAIEVTAIKTLQSPESAVPPSSAPAAIGAAESTNTPAP